MATPKANKSEQTIAAENWQRYEYARDRGHDDYTRLVKRLEDFYLGGGRQWEEKDKRAMTASRRLPLEFNQILPAIKTAIGYQIGNRMDIAFRPRGGTATQEIANVLSKVSMQIADNVDLHHKETEQFGDGMIQQRGYLSIRVDFDDSMRGEIRVDVDDPMDVIPDPDAKTYDPDGWTDRIKTRWLTLDEIEQHYGAEAREKAEIGTDTVGDQVSGDDDFGEQDDTGENRNKFGGRNQASHDAVRKEKGLVRLRVVDRQFFVYELSKVIISPDTGDVRVIEGMDPEKQQEALNRGWIPSKRMAKRVRWTVTTWDSVLHDDYSPYPWLDVVPFFPIFRRGKSIGWVDNSMGPQMALNKLASQFIHIINSSANSGWKIKENSLKNMDTEDLEEKGASTGLVLELDDVNSAEKIKANEVPAGVDRMMTVLMNVLKENTMPDAARGIEQGGKESGIAIQSRQFAAQQGMTMELDNLGRTRNILARRILWCIQNYYDDQRIFRISKPNPETGEPDEEVLTINAFDEATGEIANNVTLGEYDVIVSETPVQVTFENGQFEQAVRMRELLGDEIPADVLIRTSALADKNELLRRRAKAQPKTDPLIEAETQLKAAQTRKTDAEATSKSVETQFSAIQTAQVIATTPQTAPLADALLRSAGYQDQDAAPIVPEVPQGIGAGVQLPNNTNPLTPLNPSHPAVGLNQGIETSEADSAI